jgi:hypothetical protein
MAHGYAGVREHGIAKFAEAFADAGFVVLLHEPIFGRSRVKFLLPSNPTPRNDG